MKQIPLGRFAEAGEVARIACFLLSDDALAGYSGGWWTGDVGTIYRFH